MKVRIITSIVAIIGIFPFFWLSDPVGVANPLHYVFPFLICAIAFVSTFELLQCIGLDKNYYIAIPLYLAAIVFPALARIMYTNTDAYIKIAILTVLVLIIYLFGVIVFRFGKVDSGKIALAFMTSLYVIGSFSAIILLRDNAALPTAGRYLFLMPFIFSWTTDSFAYFSGRLFGKHKLIPQVSPKKTVEGSIGGMIFCVAVACLYGLIVKSAFGDVAPNYVALIVGGLLASVVSQIGDLVMSAIKRQYGIKDFGFFLPGHGGLLDRFDSSIAVTVLLVVINAYYPFFTVI